jgi:hypothetical protein
MTNIAMEAIPLNMKAIEIYGIIGLVRLSMTRPRKKTNEIGNKIRTATGS